MHAPQLEITQIKEATSYVSQLFMHVYKPPEQIEEVQEKNIRNGSHQSITHLRPKIKRTMGSLTTRLLHKVDHVHDKTIPPAKGRNHLYN
jgi:hypothetical protein